MACVQLPPGFAFLFTLVKSTSILDMVCNKHKTWCLLYTMSVNYFILPVILRWRLLSHGVIHSLLFSRHSHMLHEVLSFLPYTEVYLFNSTLLNYCYTSLWHYYYGCRFYGTLYIYISIILNTWEDKIARSCRWPVQPLPDAVGLWLCFLATLLNITSFADLQYVSGVPRRQDHLMGWQEQFSPGWFLHLLEVSKRYLCVTCPGTP